VKYRWICVSLLALFLTRCTWQPAAVASKEFEPAPSPMIHRTGYTLAYDGRTRHAGWVYEELTAESLKGEAKRAEFDFVEDPLLPAHLRATKSDYQGSGFDRGHLSPAGNAKSSPEMMKETFYLSNISPQHPQLNRKYWVKLETHVREMTKSHAKVCVITGPLFIPELNDDGKKYVRYQVIGENQVAVPTHYFKVIYGKTDNEVITEAYVIPNRLIENDPPLKTFSVALENVEKAAGLTFKKIP
jgi:endonuclease G